MNVCEGHRARHLVVRLDRGEELPNALVRALSSYEARSAVITGLGAFEAVEIAHYDQARRTYDRARRIDAPTEVVSLTGNVATLDGVPTVRLSGLVSRETELGVSTVGGQIVWARVFQLELHVTVFDDITLTRAADERTGLPILNAQQVARAAAPVAPATPASAPTQAPTQAAASEPILLPPVPSPPPVEVAANTPAATPTATPQRAAPPVARRAYAHAVRGRDASAT